MIIKHHRTLALLVCAVAAAGSTPASAREISPRRLHEEARIGACIARSANGRAWLEKTLWGLRDQEGGWIGADIANGGGSHDLGPLQVNSWWIGPLASVTNRPAASVRYWLINDACFNVDVARWIFLASLADTGDYWRAIGAYHSPVAQRQGRYAASVARRLKRRFGREIFTDAGRGHHG
jgi:hypothetical protein